MRLRRLFPVTIALGLTLALLVSAAASAGGRPFRTSLSGAEEANAAGMLNQGDPNGTGFAALTFNPGLGQVCYHVTVANTSDILFSHIHAAPAGVPGPIVITLFHFGFESPSPDRDFAGCVSADRELVKTIMKNPTAYYVNVHSTEFPAGAVRGQLGD